MTGKNGAQYLIGKSNPAPDPGPGRVLTDGRSVGEIVKSLLPTGLTSANHGGQDSYNPAKFGVMANAVMSLDDGTGRLTTVSATVQQNQYEGTTCTAVFGTDPSVSECQASPQTDGSVVLTFRVDDYDPKTTGGPTKGSYTYTAVRVFPDGMGVTIQTSNFFDPLNDPHEKGWHVSPTRATTLLTTDQLKAMVMDPRWGLTVPAEFAQQARRDLVPYVDYTQKN